MSHLVLAALNVDDLKQLFGERLAHATLTPNRPVEDWGKLLSGATAVSAMLDRLPHHGHVLKCGPRSWGIRLDAQKQ